jgi:hypothetical protein
MKPDCHQVAERPAQDVLSGFAQICGSAIRPFREHFPCRAVTLRVQIATMRFGYSVWWQSGFTQQKPN